MTYLRRKKDGYTLLFAVLTAALVLGVGTFILGIARKQYILSSTARDSTVAVYAADSGIECAVEVGISGYTVDYLTSSGNLNISIPCANNDGVIDRVPTANFALMTDLSSAPSEFNPALPIYQAPPQSDNTYIQFLLRDLSNTNNNTNIVGCFLMKIWSGTDFNNVYRVVTESRGYNLCHQTPSGGVEPLNSRRTVERAMRVVE